MLISIVAALSQNRVIGRHNRLPWKLPADMKHFRSITMGKPVLMGRKTYESIGKPLAGRLNVIVTKTPAYQARECIVAHSIEEAIHKVHTAPEVMVIGGASFYAQLLPIAERMYLTLIHRDFEGDAYFPRFSENDWIEIARTDCDPDERNPYPYSFVVLEKRAVD